VLRDSGEREGLDDTDRAARDADLADLPPTAAEVLSRLRDDPASDPFRDEAERLAFRDEIDARIGDERAIDLATGDDAALEEVLEDRLDRLYMAKAYLQSEAALDLSRLSSDPCAHLCSLAFESQGAFVPQR